MATDIQEDGKALDESTVATQIKDSPRFQIMERARAKRAEEHGLTVEPAEEEKPEDKTVIAPKEADDKLTRHGDGAVEEEEEDAGKKAPEKKEGEVEAAVTGPADDAIVEIKVNGETKKLTWAEAKKSLQLGLASEETLEQAKRKKQEADDELRAARAARAVAGEPEHKEPAAKEPTAAEKAKTAFEAAKTGMRAARKKFTEASQYGTPEEVTAAEDALAKAEDAVDEARDKMAESSRAAVEPQADPLVERESVDTDRATKGYLENFKEDRKDKLFARLVEVNMREEVTKDLTQLGAPESILAKLTDQELGEHHFKARSRGLVRTMDQVFTAAGNRAREELKARTGGTSPQSKVGERKEAKEKTLPSPRVAAGRVPEGEEEKPVTSADLVAEHRRRRGRG